MAKNSIRDFSATANSNTDIQSVDIDENCAASGLNNAIRELMADLKDVSTGAVALETPQADSLTLTGNLNMSDNDKIVMGTGDDLEIYHNGTKSFIADVGTGSLNINSDGTGVYINKGTTENMAKFLTDGAVELYYDDAKKFVTTSDGIEALRPASDGIIQSWRRGTTEVMKLTVASTDNVELSAMQGGGSGLQFWGAGGTDPYITPLKEGSTNNGGVTLGRSSERFKELYLAAEGGSTAAIGTRQGLAKVWSAHETIGTASTYDSYNQTSLTDLGTARARVTIANNMNNGNYSISGGTSYGYTTYSQFQFDNQDAGQFESYNSPDYNKNFADGIMHATVHGDLA
jgi:hypothetical protein